MVFKHAPPPPHTETHERTVRAVAITKSSDGDEKAPTPRRTYTSSSVPAPPLNSTCIVKPKGPLKLYRVYRALRIRWRRKERSRDLKRKPLKLLAIHGLYKYMRAHTYTNHTHTHTHSHTLV